MKLYKLTDQNGMTRAGYANACQWGENATHSGDGTGELCGPGYIHAYTDPLLAVLLNPIHAAFSFPRLWESEGEIALRDGQLKCGCASLTTVRELPLPVVTTEQRVRFGVLCALAVYDESTFVAWANDWLSGKDRSRAAARAAWAASAAAYAAYAADAASAAAYAADAARRAAYAAAGAAAGAAARDKALDLAAIARVACEVQS